MSYTETFDEAVYKKREFRHFMKQSVEICYKGTFDETSCKNTCPSEKFDETVS